MHLKVMTWPDPGVDEHSIPGSLDDLDRLAGLVERSLAALELGKTARIRDAFSSDCAYSLVLDLRPDGFDPASADASLQDDSKP